MDSNPPPRPKIRGTSRQSHLRNHSQWLFQPGLRASDGKVLRLSVAVHSYKMSDSFRTGRYSYTSKAGYQGHRLMATACALLNRSSMLLAHSFALRRYGRPTERFSGARRLAPRVRLYASQLQASTCCADAQGCDPCAVGYTLSFKAHPGVSGSYDSSEFFEPGLSQYTNA